MKSMIQDIQPDYLNNSFLFQQPSASDAVMSFHEGRLSVTYDPARQELLFPQIRDFPVSDAYQYLFSVSSARYFLNLTSSGPESVLNPIPCRNSGSFRFSQIPGYLLPRPGFICGPGCSIISFAVSAVIPQTLTGLNGPWFVLPAATGFTRASILQ